jgi:hypothetical protein
MPIAAAINKQSRPLERRHGIWLILELFGVVLLIWHGLPIYRAMLSDPPSQIGYGGNLIWALVASMLIQAAYWYRYYDKSPALPPRNVFVGHIVLFISRLSFLFATSSFGYIFITGNIDLEVSGLRYLVFFVGLFSLFCFVQELDRIGKALCTPSESEGR